MKRVSKTVRVRETYLKTYFHLRAIFKVDTNDNESFIFEQILVEGMEAWNNFKKQGKKVIVGHFRGTRYVMGGNLSADVNDRLTKLAADTELQKQEMVEVLIHLCAVNRFTKEEQLFFKLNESQMFVVDMNQNTNSTVGK